MSYRTLYDSLVIGERILRHDEMAGRKVGEKKINGGKKFKIEIDSRFGGKLIYHLCTISLSIDEDGRRWSMAWGMV